MDLKPLLLILSFCSALNANAEPLGGWDTFPGPVAEPDTTQGD